MKQIDYSLICEGFAENYSLPKIIEKFGKEKGVKFLRSKEPRIAQSANPSKSKVLKKATEYALDSLGVREHDVFIIGVDLDENDLTHELSIWEKQKTELQNLIAPKFHDKSVIFVSIQAFDYWLLYQKYKISNFVKPASNSLEAKTKKEIKNLLYGKSNPSEREIKKVCEEISTQVDITELQQQSKSFNKFIVSLNKIL